jgi:hypothetical protein
MPEPVLDTTAQARVLALSVVHAAMGDVIRYASRKIAYGITARSGGDKSAAISASRRAAIHSYAWLHGWTGGRISIGDICDGIGRDVESISQALEFKAREARVTKRLDHIREMAEGQYRRRAA